MTPQPDYLAQIIQQAKEGHVFTIDQGDKPVAIVFPARYIDALAEGIDNWNDGRLVIPEDGRGWRRAWHLIRFLYQTMRGTRPKTNSYNRAQEAQPL